MTEPIITCPRCAGTGAIAQNNNRVCLDCLGKGWVKGSITPGPIGPKAPELVRNGVRYWSVYRQMWVTAAWVPQRELDPWNQETQAKVDTHLAELARMAGDA